MNQRITHTDIESLITLRNRPLLIDRCEILGHVFEKFYITFPPVILSSDCPQPGFIDNWPT